MSLFEPRQLYDMDYVKGGCIGAPPAGSNLDDTFGTYATNYAVGLVGLCAAVVFIAQTRNGPFSFFSFPVLASNYFGWTGLGYALAGFLHQVYRTEELRSQKAWAFKLSYIMTLLGIMSLGLIASSLLVPKACDTCLSTADLVMKVVVMVGALIVIGINSFGAANLIITGVFSLVVILYALITWALYSAWPKVLGAALMIAGMIVQLVLAPKCGDAAYANCWKECPLPAPYFNHNALFHVLFAFGLLILAVAMAKNPDTAPPPRFFDFIQKEPANWGLVQDDRSYVSPRRGCCGCSSGLGM